MKSYLFIVLFVVGVGFALTGPLLWHLRKELALGWREQLGIGGSNENELVKERADILRSMEPFSWKSIVLLTVIVLVICFAFGVVVADGGVVLYIGGLFVVAALIALFNKVLFAQLPRLPVSGSRDAGKADSNLDHA
jgi:hypothetical protein